MDIVVDTIQPVAVEVGATGIRQLAQEIRTLLSTAKGSVPLDRDFGIDWSLVDMPTPEARSMYIAEVAAQIHKYIPRVRFKGIKFPDTGDAIEGYVGVALTVEIKEEYLDEFSES